MAARVGSFIESTARAMREAGVDLSALGLAWARVMPSVILVPAFGLRALPTPARGVLALVLAMTIFPSATFSAPPDASVPWIVLLLFEALRGLPVAVAAAVPLWAATMAGTLVDQFRGSSDSQSSPVVEGKSSSFGVLFSLLAGFLFLASGGPSRVAMALVRDPMPEAPLLAIASHLVHGITLAVSIGAPLVVAAMVLEVASALVARAASPAQVHALTGPLRAFGILAVVAAAMDRIAWLLRASAGP